MPKLAEWATSSRLFAITIALLFFGATLQREFGTHTHQDVDFHVYYFTAAILHGQHSGDIYHGALDGNPQLRDASADSPIYQKAHAAGIFTDVMLYLYPPLTADLLVPLTRLSPHAAASVWRFLNLCFVAFSVLILSRLMGLRVASAQFFVFLVAAFCFFPIIEALAVGQIMLLMLLSWTVSVASYQRDYIVLSAVALAFASMLKVTPVLAVPLFLLWNERKWVMAYLATIAALLVSMGLFNGWHMLGVAARVLGAMGGGLPILDNKCISSVVEWIYYGRFFTAADPLIAPTPVLSAVSKAASLAFYGMCLFLVWRRVRREDAKGRTTIFAVFALVSMLCSPIAWRAAYAVALVPLSLLWMEALRNPTGRLRSVLLAVTSVATGSVALDLMAAVPHVPWALRIPIGAIWTVASCALCLDVLGRGLREKIDGVEGAQSMDTSLDSNISMSAESSVAGFMPEHF